MGAACRRWRLPVRDVQEGLESSVAGRAAISSLLFLILTGMIVANLPDSYLRRTAWRFVRPYVVTMGIEQAWGVFAPEPRRQVLELEARITYTDGSEATWRVPDGDPIFAAYRDYRWRKWVEYVTLDASRDELWQPAAQWVARRFDRADRHPARVTLVRRWYDIAPPGTPQPDPPEWQEFAYFVFDLRPLQAAPTVVP